MFSECYLLKMLIYNINWFNSNFKCNIETKVVKIIPKENKKVSKHVPVFLWLCRQVFLLKTFCVIALYLHLKSLSLDFWKFYHLRCDWLCFRRILRMSPGAKNVPTNHALWWSYIPLFSSFGFVAKYPANAFCLSSKILSKKVTLAQRCQTSPNVVPINFHLMPSCQNTFQKFIRWLFKISIRNALHF